MIKRYFIAVIFFVITVIAIPFVVFFFMNIEGKKEVDTPRENDEISVFFKDENEARIMDMDEYLCGVVSAEMPAEFETEALKAQAVAARSYACYRKENPSPDHPDAAVCTDFAHCKAYRSPEVQKTIWGEDAKKYSQKIADAVYKTSGEIITYNGEVAMAVFHSQTGAGKTENSKDVWGGEVPYLISVESHGEESAPNFYSTQIVSFKEFKEKLVSIKPDVKIETPLDIGVPVLSEGGSVKNLTIGGKEFSGKEIRSVFSLRSSCFKIMADNETVTFEVTGYGHGVGMSQYGANTMAKEGYSYIDILKHYYTGIQISGV